MNLELTEDQEFFRSNTRKFLESEVPLSTVRALYDSMTGFDRSWWARAAELGWTSMFVPEAHGGGSLSGRPTADLVIVAEEMGRLISPGPLVPVNVVAAALAEQGTAEQQAALLPGLLSGQTVASWAACEPHRRWAEQDIRSTARLDGGDVVLDGVKAYVEAAAEADFWLVTARTDNGLTQVLVPVDTEGATVAPGRSIDMTRRFATVTFTEARVGADAVLGSAGGAGGTGGAFDRQLALAIVLQCAEMCGVADRALEFTLEYGRDRLAFGRPIVSFQAIKHRVADMTVRLEGSKAVTEALAAAVDSAGELLGSDEAAAAGLEASRLASVAKAYVGTSCLNVVDDCVQITGGIGVTWEHDIHMYNRRAAVDRAVFGSPEEHKERLLRLLQTGEVN